MEDLQRIARDDDAKTRAQEFKRRNRASCSRHGWHAAVAAFAILAPCAAALGPK